MEEAKKIYIGNLEFSLKEEYLKRALADKGIHPTDIKVIVDKHTGKSKGFAFAEFNTQEEAQQAIEALNGFELNSRALRVNKAKKMKPRPPGGGFSSNRFGNRRPDFRR